MLFELLLLPPLCVAVLPLLLLLEPLSCSEASVGLEYSLGLPLASASVLWVALDEGAGDEISIGSPVVGGDILMVGVGIGTTRAPIDSLLEVGIERERMSVLTAMCAVAMMVSQNQSRASVGDETRHEARGERRATSGKRDGQRREKTGGERSR